MKKQLLVMVAFFIGLSLASYMLIFRMVDLPLTSFTLLVLCLHVIFLLLVFIILNLGKRPGHLRRRDLIAQLTTRLYKKR